LRLIYLQKILCLRASGGDGGFASRVTKPVTAVAQSPAVADNGQVWFFWPRFIGVARFFVHHWESLTPENTARLVHSKNAAGGNGVGVRETHQFVTRRLESLETHNRSNGGRFS